MSSLPATNPVGLSSLLSNISLYKYNPVNIQQAILAYLTQVLDGEVDIVDPSTPFVFSLEASAVNTAACMIENELNTRRLYPALAMNMDELYLHMSDQDFLGIFSTPATGQFNVIIEKNSLLSSLVADPITGTKRLIIGGNTFTTVNNLVFSLQYPIIIEQYPSGSILIYYDDSQISPIQTLNGTNIPYFKTTDINGVEWYSFQIPMIQVSIESNTYPLLGSTYLKPSITFTNNFYYCRVFNQTATGGPWTEIATTFTDQVYDPTTPTAVLKLTSTNTLEVAIPPVYVTTGLLTGNIRVDIYETTGVMNINLNNYAISSFSTTLLDLNETTVNTEYYATANNLTYLIYSDQVINGGSNALTLDELRAQVISNSVGANVLPITTSQLQSNMQYLGFNINLAVDVITDRIFKASSPLPSPVNQSFITPVAVSMESVALSFSDLESCPTATVNSTKTRATLLPSTLYQNANGVVSIYTNPSVAIDQQLNIADLQLLINSNNLLYTPYYYILDNSGSEFDVRAYQLNLPQATQLGFYGANSTVAPITATGTFLFAQTPTGYKLTLVTQSNNAYQALPMGSCGVQISYIDPVSGNRNYIQGKGLGFNSNNEKIFEFNITTNYDIDSNDYLYINGNNSQSQYTLIPTALSQTVDIIYYLTTIPTGFVPSSFQTKLNTSIVASNTSANPSAIMLAAITNDQITLNYGQPLEYLWVQHRSSSNDLIYETYTRDIPLRYTSNVYQTDPVTGSILQFDSSGAPQFTVLHSAGDIVVDSNGNPIIKYAAGTIITDSSGNPKYINYGKITHNVDILLFDATFYFATHKATISYINGVNQLITQWCSESLPAISASLIEQTEIYFYPQRTYTQVEVMLSNNSLVSIPSGQSLTVDFYVPKSVNANPTLQARIESITTALINNTFATSSTISISQICKTLLDQFGSEVIDVQIYGLGGSVNYPLVIIQDPTKSLSINKELSQLADKSLTVVESITYNFSS